MHMAERDKVVGNISIEASGSESLENSMVVLFKNPYKFE